MKKNAQYTRTIITGLIIFLLVVGLATVIGSFKVVQPNMIGVGVRFGKILNVYNEGWYILPFATMHKYDMRVIKNVVELQGKNSAVDRTGQDVYATINVNYKIKQEKANDVVLELYRRVGSYAVIEDRMNLDAIIKEGFKQATVEYEALEILEKRQEVKERAKNNIKKNFPTEYFEIVDIVVTNIAFSDGFSNAIEQKKVAEQLALKEQNQLEVVVFQQKQEIERFKADAEKIKLQSQALTELTLRQKYLETWDGKLPMYMIANQDTVNMFLPSPALLSNE